MVPSPAASRFLLCPWLPCVARGLSFGQFLSGLQIRLCQIFPALGTTGAQETKVPPVQRMTVPRYGENSDVIGLPKRAICITNSERITAACPLRWAFRYADGLQSTGRSAPLAMGSAVHACVEDVHQWWQETDQPYPGSGLECVWCTPFTSDGCKHCHGTERGPVAIAHAEWLLHSINDPFGEYDAEAVAKDAERLLRIFDGWIRTYGAEPDSVLRVVAPELKMALPVLAPNGKPYKGQIWTVPTPTGYRTARTGEAALAGAKLRRWPVFQCLTVDALMQNRETGDLWIYECKTAKSPDRRLQSVSIDPQVQGYAHAVRVLADAGKLEHLQIEKGTRVAGVIFDVLSNSWQADPDLLAPQKVKALDPLTGEPIKKGSRWVYELDPQTGEPRTVQALSRSSRSGVPSWRYRKAIADHGLDPADYSGHLLDLSATVDRKLYQREFLTSGPEVGARYARELHSVAQQICLWRRKAAEMQSPEDRDRIFPRQPVCIGGYGCAYRAPCLQDGDLVRTQFERAEMPEWYTTKESNQWD